MTETIGPQGGKIQVGYLTVEFFPNAVSEPTAVTITELTEDPPADLIDLSPMYAIEPVDLVLDGVAQVTLVETTSSWTFANTVYDINDEEIWYLDGEQYEALPEGNLNAGFVTAALHHFGRIMAAVPATPTYELCEYP